MKTRTRTQYRVSWLRTGNATRRKTFYSRKPIDRLLTLLGPEPWKAYTDKGPDELECCEGGPYQECGCGGLTVRQASDEKRKDMPPVEWVRVEKRSVTTTAWERTEPEPEPRA